jgi:hypothetical protein
MAIGVRRRLFLTLRHHAAHNDRLPSVERLPVAYLSFFQAICLTTA